MDFCDKCGEEINNLEPCFRLAYGFSHEGDFIQDSFLMIHLDCISDDMLLTKILEHIKKN
jgi:hypothetical protein|tara:strand:- start:224 stop:403 length:180 start_codon:yes stop_codon:yes gene_type:complete